MPYSTEIGGVISETQEIINLYVEAKEKSGRTIMSALRRLFSNIKKQDIQQLNYEDYCKYVKPIKTTQASLQTEFIKFLYAHGFLNNQAGFEQEYWNPTEIRRYFEKGKTKRQGEKYKAALTFEQIQKIQLFLNSILETDFDNMRLDLCYYMCYYTSINSISDLREADTKTYSNDIWTIANKSYRIPKRYESFLLDYQKKQNSGFSSIFLNLAKLGRFVGIDNLTPKRIMKARDQMQQRCFQCGRIDYIFSSRWKVINGILICYECAEKIIEKNDVKKNYSLGVLDTFEVDLVTAQEKEITETATSTFDVLKGRMPYVINYVMINEYLNYIGRLGEKYVFEYEKQALQNTEYYDKVDPTPSLNPINGYDILSYESDGTEVMIEVKTTNGLSNDAFFITNNELETYKKAKMQGKSYKVYRVGQIEGNETPSLEIYNDLSANLFEIENVTYRFKLKEQPAENAE